MLSLGRVGRETGEEGFLLNGKVLSLPSAVTAERSSQMPDAGVQSSEDFLFFKYVCEELSELILKR